MISHGEKFGRLTILCPTPKRKDFSGDTYWTVICDCGKNKVVGQRNLLAGTTTSCGCKADEIRRRIKVPPQEVALNRFFSSYESGAKKRGLEFILTKKDVKRLCSKICNYCKREPREIKYVKKAGFFANGLDRKDNCKGYTLENTVPCCKVCNSMKSNLTENEFKDQIKRIYLNFVKDDK